MGKIRKRKGRERRKNGREQLNGNSLNVELSRYCKAGVPNPQAVDWYPLVACGELAAQQKVSGGRARE